MKNKTKIMRGVIILIKFTKYSSEIQLSGQIAVGGRSAVIGKVRFFDESYTEGSILCVRGNEKIDRETLLLCPPIAIIVFCDDFASSLGELCSLGIPCLVINKFNKHFDIFKNKIALIDTLQGTLILDPSIDTIELYLSSKEKCRAMSLNCSVGKAIRDINIKKASEKGAEHFLAYCSMINQEDIFESAVGLWEKFCPELLIFDIPVPCDTDNEERNFSELAEELYRAALYGSIAVSLSQFSSEDELSSAMRIFHKAFCLLEAEGREFNAYLPRGITLASPLWLMRPCPVKNPDFLILDLDFLLPSLFSLSEEQIIKKEKALTKELLAILERYFLNFAPPCDIFIKAERFSNTAILREFIKNFKVKIVFL